MTPSMMAVSVIPATVRGRAPKRSTPRPASGLRTWRDSELTIQFPAAWVATDFRGAPAPTAFPLVYLSENHLGGPCPTIGAPPDRRGGGE